MADPKNASKKVVDKDTSVVVDKERDVRAATGQTSLSSVGAELAPEAKTFKEDGMVVLDAGGPHVSAAPRPTPAEAVAYPSTGGLPDTGPNSKYALGEERGPKLFNEDGERVDRDGVLIDPVGDRIIPAVTPEEPADVDEKDLPASTREEMKAGKAALNR